MTDHSNDPAANSGNDQIHDQIHEQLSAYMDGELPETEQPLLRRRLENDPVLRARWSRYHLVRDVLHNHTLPSARFDISARVHEALIEEPGHPKAGGGRAHAYKPFVGAAIAASVALLAILGVQRISQVSAPAPATVAVAQTPAPGVADYRRVAGARWDLGQPEVENNLNQYLLSHKRHADGSGMPGMLPYARIVGYDTSE